MNDEEEISRYNSSESSESEDLEMELDDPESSNDHSTGDENNESKGGDSDEYIGWTDVSTVRPMPGWIGAGPVVSLMA